MWYPFFMDKRTQLLRVATLQEEERKFIDEACIASGLQKAVFYKTAILSHAQTVLLKKVYPLAGSQKSAVHDDLD